MQKAAGCLLVIISTTVGYKRQAINKKGQERHADVGLYLMSRGFVMQPKLCIAQSCQVHVHKPLYILRFSVALPIKTLNLCFSDCNTLNFAVDCCTYSMHVVYVHST